MTNKNLRGPAKVFQFPAQPTERRRPAPGDISAAKRATPLHKPRVNIDGWYHQAEVDKDRPH